MQRIFKNTISCVIVLCIIMFIQAMPIQAAELYFSTTPGYNSWTAEKTTDGFKMSFDHLVVDYSRPYGSALIGDTVVIPDLFLNVSNDSGGIINASIQPLTDNIFYILDDITGKTVLQASMGTGSLFNIAKSYLAYSDVKADLTNLSTNLTGYSTAIDDIISAYDGGYPVDMSFSGESGKSLYSLLHGSTTTSVSGGMSGEVSVIPEPASIALFIAIIPILRHCRRLSLL